MTSTTDLQAGADLISLTADIVSAYVSNNPVPVADLSSLIADVHHALQGVGNPVPEPIARLEPAVSIRRSVTPDYIVCLEDGKKFKSLKRHLATSYMLSPDEYRRKWNLPSNYPMVAPSYAAARSALAKASGLGTKRGAPEAPATPRAKRPDRAATTATAGVVTKSSARSGRSGRART